MKESNIFKLGMMRASELGYRMFRVNVGTGWTGNKIKRHKNGDVTISGARPFSTGVPKGFSDSVGWKPTVITQDMVGKTVAVFTAHEYKTPTGRPTKEQLNFGDRLTKDGGDFKIIRHEDEIK